MSRDAETDLADLAGSQRAANPLPAQMAVQLQPMVGNRAMGNLVAQRDPSGAPAAFTPTFGGDAGVLDMEYLNASIKLTVPVKNAASAPSGTSMVWSWGTAVADGVERGDISPATGPTATFNAKAKTPSSAGQSELGANLEVTLPGQSPEVHAVSPPMQVSVMHPEYQIEQKVIAGATGGGSASALKPSDMLEIRITFDNVDKPQEFSQHFSGVLSHTGLILASLGGDAIPDDRPFENRPYRWEGNTLVYTVYCHHAGTSKFKVDFKIPGAPEFSREFDLKSETSLRFFLDRCNAATDRHRALLAAVDGYIYQGWINYMAGYNAAKSAFEAYAHRVELTNEILLGILFAGLGGAAGGAVGALVKPAFEQKVMAGIVKSALTEATTGAVTDAAKDMVKYTVRLGRKLAGGGSGGSARPDDATPESGTPTTSKDVPGSVDPLNWYAAIEKAKAGEEVKVANQLTIWKTTTINAIAQGSEETVDFDPVNAMNDVTVLDGKNVTQLGSPPSAEQYEKNMWEAWIDKYAYTLKDKIGCHQWGKRVEDNVSKELRDEMERVAKVLAEKGIDPSWLTEALEAAKRRADEEAAASQRVF